ncbi:hypothetical protein GGR56DRAFT_44073 [Xylariaceae sp. FL0804]|nr:hypothetical protein GGR56DRAFT_44073 [Xylariaceae sp. FL0804]
MTGVHRDLPGESCWRGQSSGLIRYSMHGYLRGINKNPHLCHLSSRGTSSLIVVRDAGAASAPRELSHELLDGGKYRRKARVGRGRQPIRMQQPSANLGGLSQPWRPPTTTPSSPAGAGEPRKSPASPGWRRGNWPGRADPTPPHQIQSSPRPRARGWPSGSTCPSRETAHHGRLVGADGGGAGGAAATSKRPEEERGAAGGGRRPAGAGRYRPDRPVDAVRMYRYPLGKYGRCHSTRPASLGR